MTAIAPSPPRQVGAALLLGSLALLILGLQPLLLGELFSSGRASLDGLGLVAMGEIVALGLGVLAGEAPGPRLGLPPVLVPATLLAVAAERLSGLFMALQTLCPGLRAALLALCILPRLGSSGGFLLLAGVTALALPLTAALPRRLAALDVAGSAPVRRHLRRWMKPRRVRPTLTSLVVRRTSTASRAAAA